MTECPLNTAAAPFNTSIDSTEDKSPKGTLFNNERSSLNPSTATTVSFDPRTEKR